MKKKMETTKLEYIGVTLGITEEKMETSIVYLGIYCQQII